jgi:hypothetical protein
MEWHKGRPRLRLAGYRSANEVEEIFASFLVDVAYVVGGTPDALHVVADDPAWPADSEDYNWLCEVIRETLATHGIMDIELALLSQANRQPSK